MCSAFLPFRTIKQRAKYYADGARRASCFQVLVVSLSGPGCAALDSILRSTPTVVAHISHRSNSAVASTLSRLLTLQITLPFSGRDAPSNVRKDPQRSSASQFARGRRTFFLIPASSFSLLRLEAGRVTPTILDYSTLECNAITRYRFDTITPFFWEPDTRIASCASASALNYIAPHRQFQINADTFSCQQKSLKNFKERKFFGSNRQPNFPKILRPFLLTSAA